MSTPSDPDYGKDLSYLVPTDQVAWGTPPSFNNPPPGASGSGSGSSDVIPVGPFRIDTGSVRAAESSMLGATREAIASYEALKEKVLAVKDTVWIPPQPKGITPDELGPAHTVSPDGAFAGGIPVTPPGQSAQIAGAAQLTSIGKQIADEMNPSMEKALWQMGNALEVMGQFIALINQSGQTYAQTDRAAKFPGPPSS
jgi:hypothetical protein